MFDQHKLKFEINWFNTGYNDLDQTISTVLVSDIESEWKYDLNCCNISRKIYVTWGTKYFSTEREKKLR
jgi:hypothetical protein